MTRRGNDALSLAAFDKKEGLTPEEEEQRTLAKKKMLGNIRFIGLFVYVRRN